MERLNCRSLTGVFCALLIVGTLAVVSGCEDDGPKPFGDGASWIPEAMPEPLPDGGVWRMAAGTARTVALGFATGTTNPYWMERDVMGVWTPLTELPVDAVPVDGVPFDLALDANQRGVMVGSKTGGGAALWFEQPGGGWSLWVDKRNGEARLALPSAVVPGSLRAVAVRGAQLVAVGGSTSTLLGITGTIANSLQQTDWPTAGDPNEKALVDVAIDAAGIAWACGFDDGADGSPGQPNAIVARIEGDQLSLVSTPCAGCTNMEFRAIAVTPEGGVLLGGSVTDFSAGAEDDYVAFLKLYSPSTKEWTDLVLPHPGDLDRVNDILVASDGRVLLACGEGRSSIVMMSTGKAPDVEWEGVTERVWSLVETSEGGFLGGGVRIDGVEEPVVLGRRVVN